MTQPPTPLQIYLPNHMTRRPFRAVRLENRTTHSLGCGICEVFVDGNCQGKCVTEPTKTDEEVLSIYAKETGVRIFKETSSPESRRMAIKISEGSSHPRHLEIRTQA